MGREADPELTGTTAVAKKGGFIAPRPCLNYFRASAPKIPVVVHSACVKQDRRDGLIFHGAS
ncbi:MAG TPA: hypothetical protein VK114_01005 [Nitrososphaerales archaeon]|nr:hypothetical protein [Nitrososphaerales archaeon]